MVKIINRDMTPEEIAERHMQEALAAEQEEAAKKIKEEAIQKINSLGLTVEEIKAALGMNIHINLDLPDGV